ncbi:MAG: putative toxin-antitoxin system toxin component, PIN family [Anaerolineae bacterium]
MIIALYDTNIFISGTFWRGLPRRAIHLAKRGKVEVVTCESLLDELRDVLTRPDKPFRLSAKEADKVINNVRSYVRLVTPTRKVDVCRDPSDNLVIECALAGGAQYIVTGDPDLKVLRRFEEIEIVDVRTFVSLIEERSFS